VCVSKDHAARVIWSDEARVLVRPTAAYAELVAAASGRNGAAAARATLRMALALGAAVSFVNGGHLGPGRLLPAMACWSFVPLLRLAACGAATALVAGRERATLRALGLYGAGQGVWYAWLLGLSLVAVVRPGWQPGASLVRPESLVAASLALCLAWSLRVRFAFLRTVLGLSIARALAALVLMAGMFWGTVAAYFLATGQLLPRILGRG